MNKLYKVMRYDTVLTPATVNGRKDVIATKEYVGGIEKLYIECKKYDVTKKKGGTG